MSRTAVRTLFVAAALAACGPAAPEPLDPAERDALETRADEEAKRLGETLVGELKSAIANGGAVNAVNVCGDAAARVIGESASRGVAMRRTTLRARNAANAPDPFERAILERWARELPAVPSPAGDVVAGPDGREFRYLKPIFVQGLCADCHGTPDALKEGVAAALAAKYPADQATGYVQGELRGAISVRIPLGAR